MLEKNIKTYGADAKQLHHLLPKPFTFVDVARKYEISIDEATAFINVLIAYGFIKTVKGLFVIGLHPDQRNSALNENIAKINKQIDLFKKARKEAESIRSFTFKEKMMK